jgi:hypothetical protein
MKKNIAEEFNLFLLAQCSNKSFLAQDFRKHYERWHGKKIKWNWRKINAELINTARADGLIEKYKGSGRIRHDDHGSLKPKWKVKKTHFAKIPKKCFCDYDDLKSLKAKRRLQSD